MATVLAAESRTFSANGHSEQETFTVSNPATGAELARLPIQSANEVDEAVARARVAQAEWAAMGVAGRMQVLRRLRRIAILQKERMLRTIVAETGKPQIEALEEILYLADLITYYSGKAERWLADERVGLHLMKTKQAIVSYQPVGVVGVISPWNFPLVLTAGDIIPALIAGNAVVLKPSEITPLTALLLRTWAIKAGIPTDAFQVITGKGDTGAALVDAADMIAFTGSVATGKLVAARAAQTLTPVHLELGGKDAMIVLRDADLNRAVNGAVFGSLFNAGQVCIAVERIYVEEPIYAQFVQRVVQQVQRLRVGPEEGKGKVDIGPLTFPRQLQIVEQQVADARAKGATVLTGGQRRAGAGLFYEPTVLTDVTDDMLVMQEETFGPLIPIIKVANAEEAVRRANASNFGLSSSVWGKDKQHATQIARQVQAGSTVVNDVIVNYLIPEVPFGGIKESGIGYRHGGAESLRRFTHPHSILIDRIGLRREPHWFPYGPRITGLFKWVVNLLFKRK